MRQLRSDERVCIGISRWSSGSIGIKVSKSGNWGGVPLIFDFCQIFFYFFI